MAQVKLGLCYKDGEGVTQDFVTAHMWYNLSASNGNKDAAGFRDELAKEMTPADISKAQDLARKKAAEIEKDRAIE
ncbi:MAG: SEL1-like repeat protein [Planctomycetes bacterium]|nr:SEL1-like repeat protein [Planctomycetota bacterium]